MVGTYNIFFKNACFLVIKKLYLKIAKMVNICFLLLMSNLKMNVMKAIFKFVLVPLILVLMILGCENDYLQQTSVKAKAPIDVMLPILKSTLPEVYFTPYASGVTIDINGGNYTIADNVQIELSEGRSSMMSWEDTRSRVYLPASIDVPITNTEEYIVSCAIKCGQEKLSKIFRVSGTGTSSESYDKACIKRFPSCTLAGGGRIDYGYNSDNQYDEVNFHVPSYYKCFKYEYGSYIQIGDGYVSNEGSVSLSAPEPSKNYYVRLYSNRCFANEDHYLEGTYTSYILDRGSVIYLTEYPKNY
ncbi:hypothetical protein VCM39_21295 [Bacteroides sp. CG01]|nr:hypothetical protein [Bacteroides sp. CG01]